MPVAEIADHEAALSPKRVAQALDVSPKIVRSLIRDGQIRAHRIGRQWRVFGSDLQEYLARQVNRTAAT
jgi:excisionase family DNA binding protein